MGCSGPQTSSATQGIGILLSTPHTHLCERTAAVDGAGWCLDACSPIKAGFSSRHALAAELSAAGGTTASCSWLSSCSCAARAARRAATLALQLANHADKRPTLFRQT